MKFNWEFSDKIGQVPNVVTIVNYWYGWMLESLLSLSRRDLILEEILKVIKSISCSGNILRIARTLLTSLPKIVLMLLIKQFVSKTSETLSSLKSLAWKTVLTVFYRKYDANGLEVSLKPHQRVFSTKVDTSDLVCYTHNRMPLFQMDSMLYYTLGHGSYVRGLQQERKKIQASAKAKYYSYKNGKYLQLTASNYFPSNNYTRLQEIVDNHTSVAELTGVHTVLGILLNGEPGLGKSSFADFAAYRCAKLGQVYRIDLSAQVERDYKEIFNLAFHNIKITPHTIFMVDEMDKYLDYAVKANYRKHIEDATQEVKMTKKGFARKYKTDFLYELLSLLERNNLDASCLLVFCCNNFDTIFEGIDTTHFKSLNDRFMRIQFERINASEMVRYLKHYNSIFEGTKYHVDDLEEVIALIPDDLSVSYRTLHHQSVTCGYDLRKLVSSLDSIESYDLMDEASSEEENEYELPEKKDEK